jgi:hypothetical protein
MRFEDLLLPMLRWREASLTEPLSPDHLSVEGLPYLDIPEQHLVAVGAFRRLRQDARKALLKRFHNLRRDTMQTIIISGFPGIGKSFCTAQDPTISDSDSSLFSWSEPGVRHPEFPANYIKHIKGLVGEVRIIMVSSHDVVRQALVDAGLEFWLVYPARSLKDEYLQRFRDRGAGNNFPVALMEKRWDEFMDQLELQEGCSHKQLETGQHLSDVIAELSEIVGYLVFDVDPDQGAAAFAMAMRLEGHQVLSVNRVGTKATVTYKKIKES